MARRTSSTPAPTPAGAERRRAPRYVPGTSVACVCTVLNPKRARGVALMRDLSTYGVGLTVAGKVAAGAVLTLELKGKKEICHVIEACVIHAEPCGTAQTAVGCAFGSVLAEEDVAALLGKKTTRRRAKAVKN